MKYFVVAGEDRRLEATSREHLRGSFVELSDGLTHYELRGPEDGDVAVLVGGLTIPLFYWDDVASRLHERRVGTLAYSAYGASTPIGCAAFMTRACSCANFVNSPRSWTCPHAWTSSERQWARSSQWPSLPKTPSAPRH